jgi:hypothetical protein
MPTIRGVGTLADNSGQFEYWIVDLTEWHLPFGDEPGITAGSVYTRFLGL